MNKELRAIKERNARVEADKAWETSWTRRVLIAIATYVVVAVFLVQIQNQQPFLNALIPTLGYLLSTLSLPFVKRWWLDNVRKK